MIKEMKKKKTPGLNPETFAITPEPHSPTPTPTESVVLNEGNSIKQSANDLANVDDIVPGEHSESGGLANDTIVASDTKAENSPVSSGLRLTEIVERNNVGTERKHSIDLDEKSSSSTTGQVFTATANSVYETNEFSAGNEIANLQADIETMSVDGNDLIVDENVLLPYVNEICERERIEFAPADVIQSYLSNEEFSSPIDGFHSDNHSTLNNSEDMLPESVSNQGDRRLSRSFSFPQMEHHSAMNEVLNSESNPNENEDLQSNSLINDYSMNEGELYTTSGWESYESTDCETDVSNVTFSK